MRGGVPGWGDLGMVVADRPLCFLLRSDKTLQDIVYKLVPGLFKGIRTPFLLPTLLFLACCSFTLLPSFFQMR